MATVLTAFQIGFDIGFGFVLSFDTTSRGLTAAFTEEATSLRLSKHSVQL
jgi:hypothetical protein